MIEFTKMHGLGNDFVVIDATKKDFRLSSDFIRLISDRHRGVGCDQVLIVGLASNPDADFSYHIYNSDGSEAFACGNGARCVGLFIREKKLSDKKIIGLQTRRDLIFVECISDDLVRVDMGVPNNDPAALPFFPLHSGVPYQLTLSNQTISFDVVSMGNPHCVIMNADFSFDEMNDIGRELNQHVAFPEGVNVGFAKIISRDLIQLCVYERGVGMTQACGSGACAAVAVARLRALVESTVQVHQVGGVLTVQWSSPHSVLQLIGPAAAVFDGKLMIDDFQ